LQLTVNCKIDGGNAQINSGTSAAQPLLFSWVQLYHAKFDPSVIHVLQPSFAKSVNLQALATKPAQEM